MGIDIRAVLVGEGSTDLELAPHLQRLCVEAGAAEAVCRAPKLARLPYPVGRDVHSKVDAALQLHPDTNLVFVHRDADGTNPQARRREIEAALDWLQPGLPLVPVVPVRELEAWLLLDEEAIRWAVGRAGRATALDLPPIHRVELRADPKQILRQAVSSAQRGVSRRRQVTFERARRTLLETLDLDGPLRQLPAFQTLVADLGHAVKTMGA